MWCRKANVFLDLQSVSSCAVSSSDNDFLRNVFHEVVKISCTGFTSVQQAAYNTTDLIQISQY